MRRVYVEGNTVYEQRVLGPSNDGRTLYVLSADRVDNTPEHYLTMPWTLLDPGQEDPVVGSKWLIASTHYPWFYTGVVLRIEGDLK